MGDIALVIMMVCMLYITHYIERIMRILHYRTYGTELKGKK